ncbi:CubicO group peptidase (beta-lactamase class C family) [Flavobacterium arsenatis]|uniref:CubicO group peptidase (Beta-lactamase class C family) n=1 Tax=Flavobacterium arsenatis TaxID=1484332 RepID=A0ABU1TM88_9FLAO|nr:serine hydrolase domain-containing protein [Flavobacterium arsenatis]MDR6967081.1 CubicO group peptidase (beta-lactamase class C family) [Flavobacterium arsenatis]
MYNRICLLAVLFLLSNIVIAQTNKINQLDSLFNHLYASEEFNGNVLVAEQGNVIYENSFGLANEGTKEKLNIETVFELASVSKQFTAMGIVQLQKEGKLSYNDLISKYIPELKNYENVTIQNLLIHTGGLPDYMQLMMEKKGDKTNSITNENVIKFFQESHPKKEFEPGEKFSYSNTGYIMLASIIERVSGTSFENYLKEKIFIPLEMNNTFVYRRRYEPKEINNYALGYIYSDSLKRKILPDEEGKSSYYVYLDGMFGDGMVNSNLHDLLKWDRALYKEKIINNEDKKMIFSSYKTKDNLETDYGFGWFINQDSLYGKTVSHSGRWAGYLTVFERDIDNDKTIIILQNNETNITEDIRLIAQNIRKILYGQPLEKSFVLPSKILQKYAGSYTYENGKDGKIYYEFGRLWTNSNFQLKPVTETKFVVIGFSPEVTYEFILDENGEVEKLKIQQLEEGIDQTVIRKK